MEKARWYYDLISPFAYLHFHSLAPLRERLQIEPVPVLFAGMLKHWGTKGPAETAPKRLHTYQYCVWQASVQGIPFRMPPRHPFNPLAAQRLMVALEAGDDVVDRNDMVIVDMGAEVGGYRSDMTRVVVVGEPGVERRRMLETVREAQAEGVATVRAGVAGAGVDAAVRAVFAAAGCESEFLHGTGHGVGISIHETPVLGPRCEEVLRSGEVVTVEPGLYRVGVGGVRIEDLVVVGADGCRNLTLAPKELSCPRSRPTT